MIKFSIIIPVKEINDYVRETVPHIQALDSSEWELIILPNELGVDEWHDSRIKIIGSGRVGPAAKRDMGANLAQGDILVFLDDDSYPNQNLLSIASTYFNDLNIMAIGGPAVTPFEDSFWQKVSGAVFLSKYSGGYPERYLSIGKPKEVDDWPSVNFLVRRGEFLQIGGFDTPYWPGEDTKLCLNLMAGFNKKIIYVPNLLVWHHRRAGILKHLMQVGAYGLHRGYFFKKFPQNSRKLKYTLPSFFSILVIFSLISIITFDAIFVYGFPIWALYFIALLISWRDIRRYEKTSIATAAIPYIILTHFWYGLRFIQGLFAVDLKSKLR